jgi:transcription antitermination factor NusG
MHDPTASAKWYVAQLKRGRDRVAIHALGEQGFTSYYPQMQVTRAKNGRWINAPEPVFPNYLFLQSQSDATCWRLINNTRGVLRLLGNDKPCAIADREIEHLQQRERAGLLRHSRRRQIRAGDLVEFKVGSFVGLSGVVEMTRRERISVLIHFMGGATVTIAPRDWLKLAGA